jgi:hypothetical protein
MTQIVQNDAELALVAPPIRFAFRWDGVRWSHVLDAGGRTLASSVEGDPDRDDPTRVVSPAYQQASAREGPAGAQALLVGQWGPHHCSAVFTLTEAGSAVVVEADVAVRSRAKLHALASTYVVHLTSSDLATAGPSAIDWNVDAGRLRFEPAGPAGGAMRVGLAEAGRRATRVQATAAVDAAQATQRLHYRWCWQSRD